MVGFLDISFLAVSFVDSCFTYQANQIIDEGILANNTDALMRIIVQYGIFILIQAGLVLGFIYCAGKLGQARTVRPTQAHVRQAAEFIAVVLRPHAGRLADVACHI